MCQAVVNVAYILRQVAHIDWWWNRMAWWRHQMETFSTLLAICAGNSPVPGEFPTQRPVTRSFDVFFDLPLNKKLSKQSWGWWFEMLPCPLWRHCNGILTRECSVVCCLFNAWPSFMVPYVSPSISELKWCDELIHLISVDAVFTPQQGNCSSQSDSTSITDEPQGTDFFQLIQVCLWSDNLRQMRDQVEIFSLEVPWDFSQSH